MILTEKRKERIIEMLNKISKENLNLIIKQLNNHVSPR